LSALQAKAGSLPEADEEETLFAAVDTQDNGFYVALRGICTFGRTIGHGATFVQSLDGVAKYCDDNRVYAGIIDEGGHRALEVGDFVASRPKWFTYKGDSATKEACGWRRSKGKRRLILANPWHFQAELLSLLYQQEEAAAEDYWALPSRMEGYPSEYLEQLSAIRPNLRKHHGEEYRNWTNGDRADHYFDCEKMVLVLLRVAAATFKDWKIPQRLNKTKPRRRILFQDRR
jgi:hypothetical protein